MKPPGESPGPEVGPCRQGWSVPRYGLPAACLLHVPFSRNSSVQHAVPVDFMGQPQQTRGEEKHPSGAPRSSQNLISAQPEGGLSCFNPLWEGPGGLIVDPPSSLSCLPTAQAPFLPQWRLLCPHPPQGSASPSLYCLKGSRPSESSAKPVCMLCSRHLVNLGSWAIREQSGENMGMGLRQKGA